MTHTLRESLEGVCINPFIMDERGLRLEFIKQRKEFIMETAATPEARILKHLELSNEIESMGKVIHMLKKLILEITGEAPADEVKSEVAPPQPSLLDLLNQGSGRLIKHREEALEKIQTIRELIL
ncbi:hypothetical protein LCGC14_1139860 [marine sediment metagenome]|uniref:Uncharacterized protein n=1 Tax=marine sediment metagenome TaxID=412755 RepID=A0A0F9PGR2_9ZZZZ